MISFEKAESYDKLPGAESLFSFFPEVRGLKVFVKPNLVVPADRFNTVSTTNISIIRLMVEEIFNRGAREVVVGDCGFKGQWDETLKTTGLDQLAGKCTVIGLMEGKDYHKFTLKRLNNYMSLFGAKLSDYVLECDLIIDLPKLKVHSMALVTGSIKNMMGIMIQKGNMHPKADSKILHKRLRDLYFLTRDSVKFCLCDGIQGSQFCEQNGVPVHVGILISSDDMWEMDVAMSKVMGINPSDVHYLEYIRRDLGRDFEEVQVPIVVPFERPLSFKQVLNGTA